MKKRKIKEWTAKENDRVFIPLAHTCEDACMMRKHFDFYGYIVDCYKTIRTTKTGKVIIQCCLTVEDR